MDEEVHMANITQITTPSDHEILITRNFDLPRTRLFNAWTSPNDVPNWMLGPDGWTMPVCEIDLRPGGKWHFVWRKGDGSEMAMNGVYREIKSPERLVSTENWGGDFPETINTVVLTEEHGQTKMALTITYPNKEARDRVLKTGMTDGMEPTFRRLEQYLSDQRNAKAS
jgi:uncharacterized protein YndB with AHSA1/START domain